VVVENRRVKESVPIHRLPMAGRTAVDWDPKAQPGNATIRRVKKLGSQCDATKAEDDLWVTTCSNLNDLARCKS